MVINLDCKGELLNAVIFNWDSDLLNLNDHLSAISPMVEAMDYVIDHSRSCNPRIAVTRPSPDKADEERATIG
ncbi:hypothetical protein V6N11_050516 [Hibiscus sabdariffa]|uniref:Uncharacterized protein n=1 Tax=Hibiscus sabdariffa TaxID=183260 RepID=A0ABR2TA84_9ROSI